ncbi:MAG: hypothetical protein ACM31L_10780 [Actinomycetota bacterium]
MLCAFQAQANGTDCFTVFGIAPGTPLSEVIDGNKVACTSKWNDLRGVVSCEVGIDHFQMEVSSEDSGRIIHSLLIELNWKRPRDEVDDIVASKCGSGDSWKEGDTRASLRKDVAGYRFRVWKPELYDWAVKTYTRPAHASQPAAPRF